MHLPRLSLALPLLLLVTSAIAGEVATIPSLSAVLTVEVERPPAWLLPSAPPAYGMTISSVVPGMPGDRGGLRAGDHVIAIDGTGVHDLGEYQVAIATRPRQRDSAQWRVARDGAVIDLTIPDLDCCPLIGFSAKPSAEPTATLCASLGIAVAEEDLPALADLPRRLVAEAAEWFAADPKRRADPRWFAELVAAWITLGKGGDPQLAATSVPPTPLAARARTFWSALVAAGDKHPDLAHADGDAVFYALFYPYPARPALEFGAPALPAGLGELLKRGELDPEGTRAERRLAARAAMDHQYRFLGQVQAALLDPENHGGWPYRSWLVWERPARTAVVAELRRQLAAGGDDADLVAFALVGPLAKDDDVAGLTEIVTRLATTSPWLAGQAVTLTERAGRKGMTERLRAKLALPVLARPARAGIYAWCLKRSDDLSERCTASALERASGAPRAFRDLTLQVARALRGDELRQSHEREIDQMCFHLNNLAWAVATDPRLLDREMSIRLASVLRELGGARLTGAYKDSVAACFARGGDLRAAVRWQVEANRVALEANDPDMASYQERLASYRAGQPWAQPAAPPGNARRERIEHDGLVEAGWMVDDQRFGWWRTTAADGKLRAEGCWLAGRQVGPWQTWDAAGDAESAGCYLSGKEMETGPWTWWWPNGQLRESGMFLSGKRVGVWRRWHANGTPSYKATWRKGEVVGEAQTWNDQGQAATTVPEQKSAGPNDF